MGPEKEQEEVDDENLLKPRVDAIKLVILASEGARLSVVLPTLNGPSSRKLMFYSVCFLDFRLDLLLIIVTVDAETTRTLLSKFRYLWYTWVAPPSTPEPINYPFNLILTSATIPKIQIFAHFPRKCQPHRIAPRSYPTYRRLCGQNTLTRQGTTNLPTFSVKSCF